MKTFGLVGYRLGYSFSKKYFTAKFEKEAIEAHQYLNFELDTIKDFPSIFEQNKDIAGLNCTIPYKQEVMAYLDELDADAKAINAVNTIKVNYKNGKPYLIGYNTDCIGFELSLKSKLKPIHKRAIILGTGGAAAAVAYVLTNLGIEFIFASRNPKGENQISYADITANVIASHQLIINTTPLGTYPNVEQCVDIPYETVGEQHYFYDLVYNPEETTFLQRAKQKGASTMNGMHMLELQAEAAWKIWNNISD